MKKQKKITGIIRWIARIWGSIILLFFLFMVGAHIVGSFTGTEQGEGFRSTVELLSFLFFPVSIMIGLAIAWWREGLGGTIVLIGMVGFHVLRPDLILDPMIDSPAVPGILYLVYWWLNRTSDTSDTTHESTPS